MEKKQFPNNFFVGPKTLAWGPWTFPDSSVGLSFTKTKVVTYKTLLDPFYPERRKFHLPHNIV